MDSNNIVEFYDDFILQQEQSGINDRIYSLYKQLKKLGLNTNSTVLELGSGIGTMTFLLEKTIKKGVIEAVDISSASIDYAQKKIKSQNITFYAADIVTYIPKIKNPDFITLFDIIEHIPIEEHEQLFKNLSSIAGYNTIIIINLPNPDYIEYDRIHHPEELQIIDQPIPLETIVRNISNNDLNLVSFKNYSIWVENDYQLFVITRKKVFTENKLSDKRNLLQKAIKKAERTYIKMKYRYR